MYLYIYYIYISLTLLLLAAFSVDALSMTCIGVLSHLAHQSRRRSEVTGVESAFLRNGAKAWN